jgi:hypothetical protein
MAQDGTQHVVAVFNPLGSARTAVVEIVLPQSLRVQAGQAKPAPEVHTAAGVAVTAQMAPDGTSLFCSLELPAAATVSLRLVVAPSSGKSSTIIPTITSVAPAGGIQNEAISVNFTSDGALAAITHRGDSVTVKAAQKYMAYHTSMGGPCEFLLNATLPLCSLVAT